MEDFQIKDPVKLSAEGIEFWSGASGRYKRDASWRATVVGFRQGDIGVREMGRANVAWFAPKFLEHADES